MNVDEILVEADKDYHQRGKSFTEAVKSALEKARVAQAHDDRKHWGARVYALEEQLRAAQVSEPPPNCHKCGYHVNIVDGVCTHCGEPYRAAHASEPPLDEIKRTGHLDGTHASEDGIDRSGYVDGTLKP
jgi:hypothetical protein